MHHKGLLLKTVSINIDFSKKSTKTLSFKNSHPTLNICVTPKTLRFSTNPKIYLILKVTYQRHSNKKTAT